MLEATGWKFASGDGEVPVVLRSPDGGLHTLVQRYDFDHTRMTQSVVVRGPGGDQTIFVKGSFEKIAALCRPGSVAAGYGAIARHHAMNGCYVLALASRKLGTAGAEVRGMEGWRGRERGGDERGARASGFSLATLIFCFTVASHAALHHAALRRAGAEDCTLLRTY